MKTTIVITVALLSLSACADFNDHMRDMARGMREDRLLRDSLPSKPGAVVGMTTDQVLYETNWGKADHINRTVTAGGVTEQWVYSGRHGSYLYFINDHLTAIQN